jgi:hypothetical protein
MQTKLQWNSNVLEPVFRELYSIEMEKKKDYIPMMFSVESSDKAMESIEGIGGEGLLKPWTESSNQVYYSDVNELWQKFYTHIKYSGGRQIDKDFIDDMKLTAIKDRIISLADATYKTQQMQGVEDFRNAFATAAATRYNGTIYNAAGPDGVALCSTAHPYSPDNSVDVQSNAGTSSLSIDSWDATTVAMQEWVDDQGNLMAAMPDTLICAPYNRRKALQIAGINGKGEGLEPGTSDNNINVYEGQINVIVNPFLTNRYAWYAIDSSRMRRFHKWFWRRKAENGSLVDFDTETSKFKTIGRWSYGSSHYSWVYGQNATS